jgi:hypothetical protein
VADALGDLSPQGRTSYQRVIREFISGYNQRGLIIIISDFLDDDGCARALQYLADFGHELMLVQLWTDEDRVPPWTGELELQDAESGARLKLDFDDEARRRYTSAFDEYAAVIQHLAVRSGGRYVGISTSHPLEDVIFGELVRVKGIA